MSSLRIIVSCAFATIVALQNAVAPSRALAQGVPGGIPVDTRGPLEKQSKPITPENPIPRRLSAVMPGYPEALRDSRASMTVTIQITIDETGRVAEARPVLPSPRSGATATAPEPFNRAAIAAVRQWRYEPPASAPVAFPVGFLFVPGSETQVNLYGPPPVTGGTPGAPQNSAWQAAAVRTPPRKIKDRKPEWPAGVTLPAGTVVLVMIEASLDDRGRILGLRVVKGSPPFDAAALAAVRDWEYSPALADGKPIPFTMTINVAFQPGR